jgi:hypothetical protein
MLNVDRILRVSIKACRIVRIDCLEIEFENGDVLTVPR